MLRLELDPRIGPALVAAASISTIVGFAGEFDRRLTSSPAPQWCLRPIVTPGLAIHVSAPGRGSSPASGSGQPATTDGRRGADEAVDGA